MKKMKKFLSALEYVPRRVRRRKKVIEKTNETLKDVKNILKQVAVKNL